MLNHLIQDCISTTNRHVLKLRELGIKTLKDFLMYFPRGYTDLSEFSKINELTVGDVHTIRGTLRSIVSIPTRSRKSFIKGVLEDSTGKIELMWFNQPHLKRMLFKGNEIIVSGKIDFQYGKVQMKSPKYERVGAKKSVHTGRIVPLYPETDPVTSKWIRDKLFPLMKFAKMIEDSLDEEMRKEHGLLSLGEAITKIHFPKSQKELDEARKRLGFDELFALQMQIINNKIQWRREAERRGMNITFKKDCVSEIAETLPFELTQDQKKSLADVLNDFTKPYPMMRLIEGDVGSGKTIVAALAAFNIIKNGYQVAIMAPTEVLAKQHFKNFLKLLSPFNIAVNFIAGSTPAKEKERIIMGLKTGMIDCIIGTHALIQQSVAFKSLGLAIIDEQHRFGVKQRDILTNYGTPHILSLTATPIPRTLAMTIYGDQDISIIKELPPGRKEIITRVVPDQKRNDAYLWVRDQIAKGRQAYIICPLIEESEAIEVKSATDEYERLSEKVFPDLKVALLHGRMKQQDKDRVMEQFSQQEIDILVSTTVIEVGIDVPNATIMIIEGAERFGLAQLHQLRGRVGRGEHQSYCFLFSSKGSTTKRLRSMVEHASGFTLAEIDLELRGPGEVYGVRQSGLPDLKMAKLTDVSLIELAKKAASQFLEQK